MEGKKRTRKRREGRKELGRIEKHISKAETNLTNTESDRESIGREIGG